MMFDVIRFSKQCGSGYINKSLRCPPVYAHSSHTGEGNRRNDVYILGGHRALTDVSSAAHDMSCRTPVSNWELASRWASHAEGGNVSQAPREDSGPKEERVEEGGE